MPPEELAARPHPWDQELRSGVNWTRGAVDLFCDLQYACARSEGFTRALAEVGALLGRPGRVASTSASLPGGRMPGRVEGWGQAQHAQQLVGRKGRAQADGSTVSSGGSSELLHLASPQCCPPHCEPRRPGSLMGRPRRCSASRCLSTAAASSQAITWWEPSCNWSAWAPRCTCFSRCVRGQEVPCCRCRRCRRRWRRCCRRRWHLHCCPDARVLAAGLVAHTLSPGRAKLFERVQARCLQSDALCESLLSGLPSLRITAASAAQTGTATEVSINTSCNLIGVRSQSPEGERAGARMQALPAAQLAALAGRKSARGTQRSLILQPSSIYAALCEHSLHSCPWLQLISVLWDSKAERLPRTEAQVGCCAHLSPSNWWHGPVMALWQGAGGRAASRRAGMSDSTDWLCSGCTAWPAGVWCKVGSDPCLLQSFVATCVMLWRASLASSCLESLRTVCKSVVNAIREPKPAKPLLVPHLPCTLNCPI